MIAPLIVVETGYHTWDILAPDYNYGNPLDGGARLEDWRYKKLCRVDGNLVDALKVLHNLEKGQQS